MTFAYTKLQTIKIDQLINKKRLETSKLHWSC